MSTFALNTPRSTGFPAPPATGTLTFGAAAAATPAMTTNQTLNFGFSATPTTSTQTQSSGLLLGSNPTATTSTPALFTTQTTSAPLFTGLNFGTPAATTALNFGTTSTVSAPGGLSFGAPATTSIFGSGGGLLGQKPTAITTIATTNKGLGGLDVSVSNKGLSQGSNSPVAAKDNLWPQELMQTIEKFKAFVKAQKVLASDIARGSARPLNRCAEDTVSLMELLTTLAGSVQRDRAIADKLKHDTAKALQNAEIAQRTHDTPPGLQYENNAPLLFFMELADTFEHDLTLFRSQIEATEKHIQSMMAPKTLTSQELTMGMSKLHESLVAVAGKLQVVHSKVQQQKEQYLNFRKYVLKDNTNVFDESKTASKSSRSTIGKMTTGPTPFSPGTKSFLSSTALNSSRSAGYETRNPLGNE